MKSFPIVLVLLLVSSTSVWAQKSALKFTKYRWFEGVEVAQAQKKLFLIYVYQNGCEYCQELQKTLADKELSIFLNEKFVLAKHNVNSKYGFGLTQDFKLKTVPALIVQSAKANTTKPIIIYGVKDAVELKKELELVITN